MVTYPKLRRNPHSRPGVSLGRRLSRRIRHAHLLLSLRARETFDALMLSLERPLVWSVEQMPRQLANKTAEKYHVRTDPL